MSVSWGYSPKIEKFIPLGDFPADKYLIVAQQAIENLGWKLSHISETGLIAYTPISFQSYSEEISIRIHGNFAVVKSECVGIQMLLNDYGKNDLNLEKFFHEFEYVQFHLKDVWEERITAFHTLIAEQDDQYFEKAPLAIKNKIKNVLYLFFPQKGYSVTPIVLILNIIAFVAISIISAFFFRYVLAHSENLDAVEIRQRMQNFTLNFGVNHRNAVLGGQYWRLVTYQFIHGSLSHIFFNMYALIYLGLMIENKLGWKQFLFIYLVSGICGGLVSLTFHQEGIMLGASGAIMGLYGAFIVLLLNKTFERAANQALLLSTLIVSFLVLINGAFGKNVDNAAHIGGFISGAIFCYLFTVKPKVEIDFKPWKRYATASLLFLGFACSMIYFSPKYQTEEFKLLSYKFNGNLEYLNAITNLKIDLPKHAKLQSIKEDGIDRMEKNLVIIKKMQALNLKKQEAKERDRKVKLSKVSYRAVMLMYRDINGDSTFRYSKQTSKALGDMFDLLYGR
ncbi:rhomboid family intramembrane serine protease [Pedobacter sandarakinus]|uniref:rhomboid family intramembrane serine protease n=1 Tax=Pedobacter sandarakinus TaxID=353156 RepID=UPI002247330B|nr:rhomboid family intramembrane serine protease [Pedobacter sandarakinus]MCX2573964.1 rhomboid family intramembrane serine protease [Pedobacter sandarakinus]